MAAPTASQQASLASLAVQNPLFRDQAKKAAFAAVDTEEHDNELWNKNANPVDPSVLDVDEKELAEIKRLSRMMRLAMIGIATLMIITGWYNALGSSTSVSDSFLAIYLFFFAIILCCFELAIRSVAMWIVQNFGFMYNAVGKIVFLAFVAIMAFQLSTLGKVCFALLLAYSAANVYIQCKHPQYARYQRLIHYYNRARASKRTNISNDSAV